MMVYLKEVILKGVVPVCLRTEPITGDPRPKGPASIGRGQQSEDVAVTATRLATERALGSMFVRTEDGRGRTYVLSPSRSSSR